MLIAALLMAVVAEGLGAPSFAFGTECATTFEVVRPELKQIVASTTRGIFGTIHGDRAFRHDLNGDCKPELSVLLRNYKLRMVGHRAGSVPRSRNRLGRGHVRRSDRQVVANYPGRRATRRVGMVERVSS